MDNHINNIQDENPINYELLCIGLNHKTAPVELREKLSFKNSDFNPLLKIKEWIPEVKEVLFLSTCNRVEFYLVTSQDKKEKVLKKLKDFIEEYTEVRWKEIDKHFYFLFDELAIKHLFEVACGLDSLVLGEPQILGQIKSAYKKALEYKTSGLFLNKLLHRTFFVAKRVRTETGIGSGALSISYAAYILAKKILGNLKDKCLLLVGAGEMAELACHHFKNSGISKIIIVNRTFSRAVELAQRFKGTPLPLSELKNALVQADIVVSSTGAPNFVITKNLVADILKPRKFKPLFIIDIAVPRDVEPEVNKLDNVFLYDIDDLKIVVEKTLKERKKEAVKAYIIIEEELVKFKKWLNELELHPTIKTLMEKAEELRKRELQKTLKRLKNIEEEEIEALEILTKSIVQKLLYFPINFMKNSHASTRKQSIEIVRRMFKLDEDWKSNKN